ncbi:hypothetical protein Kpol_1052p35 [Vanderwaltozyma polyspora DSM 70294]|uniref:2-(3-amino-3-carboxypropyl)histidine synthase subunit 2 n=1 Tax=Vanderwaltozyma polyspora (strain ATCC 22028 / DSM 70294 / BCRC 21397 / CBS 2163 / NBRC 10782 / NRRL Y-8283 / UCD 57-17) TaxID=436907 RepID=A7TM45_VANPO|nr:uncharacterized protein Kpol_1052p35 [Vanderwaltozyma polyspora DSM 70294]EDO16687.1 hypothetical protein Kpol_1052p35 [Vanderwaltozyma polyspora DSM 70294]
MSAELETTEPLVAPSLSTAQNEETFAFQKYAGSEHDRSSYLGPEYLNFDLNELVGKYYSVDKLVSYFEQNPKYTKITLQFPDSLVQDSSIVTKLLQQRLDNSVIVDTTVNQELNSESGDHNDKMTIRKFWVLADTAYSSCCVDEVASEHVNSQIVVHFGDSCLNSIQKLPVVYSFGNPYFELEKVVDNFLETYPDTNEKICIMADTPHTQHIMELYNVLKTKHYKNLLVAGINSDLANENVTLLDQSPSEVSLKKVLTLGNRVLLADDESIAFEDSSELQQDYHLFHITMPQDPRLLYLSTIFQSMSICDPQDGSVSQGPFPSLMKRYKYMHVARTAGCIGILVNTLSLRNTNETINKISQLIKNNGKKHYLFVVGKPNVAKLANFEPVDIWCVLGCGQSGIIIDQYNEFYKPIITPYELTMALSPEVTWTGKWIVDFKEALKDVEDELEESEVNVHSGDNQAAEGESNAPEFDAVTGRYVSNSRPLRDVTHLEIESPSDKQENSRSGSNELVKKFAGSIIIKGTVSTSASHLQNRQWTGLGSDFKNNEDHDEDGAIIEEGISGVARGYQFDRDNSKKN